MAIVSASSTRPAAIPQGATRISVNYDWTGAVTAQTVRAPSAGKRLYWQSGFINIRTAGRVRLFFGTDVDAAADGSGRIYSLGDGTNPTLGNPKWQGERVGPVDGATRITVTAGAGELQLDGYEL